jgi:hypothetical protein
LVLPRAPGDARPTDRGIPAGRDLVVMVGGEWQLFRCWPEAG